MMACTYSFAFEGTKPIGIEIQVMMSSGLPAFNIVGLPSKTVAESRERVRSAISSMGLSFPAKRITVNLAPADILKEGSHYDLPIALSLLGAMDIIPIDELKDYYAMGELSLDGRIIRVAGVLPAAVMARQNGKGIISSCDNGSEAKWAGKVQILAAENLLQLVNHFKGSQTIAEPPEPTETKPESMVDIYEVKGQETARRAIEIAAAGGHNLLMVGPPGAGKSMLASSMHSILPVMTADEILEVSTVLSIAGKITNGQISRIRPFRSPHHSASLPAMIGGGKRAVPGEVSLAHNGVLFLDELAEFPSSILESLRQPLESGLVNVARVNGHCTYPARFQLVAAMNPCRCGHFGDARLQCNKVPHCVEKYTAKISGPLLDRIDICCEVSKMNANNIVKFTSSASASSDLTDSSDKILKRVTIAREIQSERFRRDKVKHRSNSEASTSYLAKICALDESLHGELEKIIEKLDISMRGYNKVLRVSRTIADLEASPKVEKHHLLEAFSYREAMFRVMGRDKNKQRLVASA